MFNIFKKVGELETVNQRLVEVNVSQGNKIRALENYLELDYYNGPKYKPHYRARRVIKKK